MWTGVASAKQNRKMSGTGYEQIRDVPNTSNTSHRAWLRHVFCVTLFGLALVAVAFQASNWSFSKTDPARQVLGEQEVVVQVPGGSVRGIETERHGARFSGIRYGRAKRFENPELAEDFSGEYDARRLPPSCKNAFNMRGVPGDQEGPAAEDCLHLDIHTTLPAKQVPVLFFIRGLTCLQRWGVFFDHDRRTQDVQSLVPTMSIVVVKVHHRTDVFGFLGSKRLQSSPNQSFGNFGTLDQQLALRWVNKNIKYFGGDHDNVCLLGWSVGAAYISVHLGSMPSSKGLFHRAIMMSGGFADWASTSLEYAEQQYDSILKATSCEKDQECMELGPPCTCLLSKSADELAVASASLQFWWAPAVDGIAVLKPPLDAVMAGESLKNIPIIMGGTLDDSDQDIGLNATESFLNQVFITPPPGLGISPLMLEEAKDIYFQNVEVPTMNNLDKFPAAYWAARQAFGDQSKLCVARKATREWQAKSGANAYWYFWKGPISHVRNPRLFIPPYGPDASLQMGHCCGCPGVCHGADLKYYLFNTKYLPSGSNYVKLANLLQTYWSGMIHSGDPHKCEGSLAEVWLPVQEGGMEFDLEMPRFNSNLKSLECDFWDRLAATAP